jgi:hypothetical protein
MSKLTVPVSLAAMLPTTATQVTTPADLVVDAGKAIVDAYKAYQDLRVLLKLINGAADASALPPELKIDEVTVAFRVNGLSRTVTLRSVDNVAELTRLLTAEAAALLHTMETQAKTAQTHVLAIQTALLAGRGQV